jgi:serralysin
MQSFQLSPLAAALASIAVTGSCFVPANAATAPNPPTLLGFKEARKAADLVAALGVNVHMAYNHTPYTNVEKVQEAAKFLGIANLRDVSPMTNTHPNDTLAGHGNHFDFILRSETVNDLPQTLQRIAELQQRHPGCVASIEGLNEANNWPAKYKGQTGYPASIAVQRDLYAAVKAASGLHGVLVYSMTLGGAGIGDYEKLGDLSDYSDQGNVHIYFGGSPPSSVWDRAFELNRHATQRLSKTVVTETGYTTSSGVPQRVDEETQAKYLLTVLVEAWQKAVPRVFIYQLVNDSLDESNWTRGLGLYRFDWTPKPSANAIHTLTTTLLSGSPAKPSNSESSLEYDISASKSGTGSLLVKKADGSFDLLVWNEQKIWDTNTHQPIPVQNVRVSLTLPQTYTRIQVVDPMNGKRQTVNVSGTRFEFDLPDHPVIIETAGTG